MSTVAIKPMTAAEFATLDLDEPAELVRGEVIEMCRPGMRHGVICKNVIFSLETWVRKENDKYLVVVEAGIITEHNPDTVRGPDIYLVRKDRLPPEGVITGFLETPPDLCIEVVSPNDNWKDVIAKVYEYLQVGVREVWLIEPDERQIYSYRPDGPPRTYVNGDTIESAAVAGLDVALTDIFRDVPAIA